MDRPRTRSSRGHTLGVATALAASVIGGCAPHPMFVGVALPFAGRDAGQAMDVRYAIELAVADANARGAHVQVVYVDTADHITNPHEDEGRDDAETSRNAIAAVRRLATDDGARLVIGGLRAPIAADMENAAQSVRVPFLPLSFLDAPCVQDGSAVQSATPDLARRYRAAAGHATTENALMTYEVVTETLARITASTSAVSGIYGYACSNPPIRAYGKDTFPHHHRKNV